jgi:hypothetical protein
MTYQYTGTIDFIGATEQVTDTFRKRILWLTNPPASDKYPTPEHVQFEATQDVCSKLDLFKAGEKVTVTFALRGRKYTSKKTGEDGVFTSMAVRGIESVHTQSVTRSQNQAFDDVPF